MHKLKSQAEAEPEPLESLRDDVPAEVVAVVTRMTAKDPSERFQTPAEVAEALSSFTAGLHDDSTASESHPQPKRRPLHSLKSPAGYCGLLALASAAGLLVMLAMQPEASPEPQVTQESTTFEMLEVDAKLAERLVGRKEQLTFTKVATLSPESAAILARHPENISFPSLKEISPEVAKALATKDKLWLQLDGIQEITPDVARELAAAKCALSLNGLTTISAEVASLLADREATLKLGLPSITPEVAQVLAKHKGWLSLSRLQAIDPESATALAASKHWISLDGLRTLTPDVAEALGNFAATS